MKIRTCENTKKKMNDQILSFYMVFVLFIMIIILLILCVKFFLFTSTNHPTNKPSNQLTYHLFSLVEDNDHPHFEIYHNPPINPNFNK